MKWTWTIKELLCGMLIIALVAAWYWNHQQGRREFNLWTTVAIGGLATSVGFYRFARDRQVIVLIGGLVTACIVAWHLWLIASL